MPDSFYQTVYDCGKDCLPYDDAGITGPSSFKDTYCKMAGLLESEAGNQSTLGGLQAGSSTVNSTLTSTRSTSSTAPTDDSDSESTSSQSRAHGNSNYVVPVLALLAGFLL